MIAPAHHRSSERHPRRASSASRAVTAGGGTGRFPAEGGFADLLALLAKHGFDPTGPAKVAHLRDWLERWQRSVESWRSRHAIYLAPLEAAARRFNRDEELRRLELVAFQGIEVACAVARHVPQYLIDLASGELQRVTLAGDPYPGLHDDDPSGA